MAENERMRISTIAGQAISRSAMESDLKDRAQRALAAASADVPQPGQVFRHYKGGLYSIVTTAIKEDTHEALVIYRSNAHGTTWARTLANFVEIVERDGVTTRRFMREAD